MEALCLLSLGAVLLFGIFGYLRFSSRWQQLEYLVRDLVEGRRPSTFVFNGSKRFMRLALQMEKLANEQERLRRQIVEEEFNVNAVLSSMVEGVMIVDDKKVIRSVNASLLKLFDFRNDPRGQSVVSAVRDASVEEMIRLALSANEAQAREISLSHHTWNPSVRHFAASAVPIQNGKGESTGVVTIFHDISRLKQLEDVRREFVANVSHELRTPLSIFQGYLENLEDNPELPREDLVTILGIMKRHSLRLNALLEDLLTLARLESKQRKLDLAELTLKPFFAQMLEDMRLKAAAKNISIQLDVTDELPVIIADKFRLEQVFMNLLDNAIKYTDNGGAVVLRASLADREILVQVKDTGIGIPSADVPHIFERFYRVEKARSREGGGTGLGLSIVKHIVQLHGGMVYAESHFGEGTTINIRLPLQPPVPTDG